MSSGFQGINDFLGLLRGVKATGKDRWQALCPGHEDHEPSLHIKLVNGRILLKCFAGCELERILKPIDLEPRDLFLDNGNIKLQDREIEAIYPYIDAKGKSFEVVRTRPKGFYQRRPDGNGGYIYNLKGLVPTLYHQDSLQGAIKNDITIYLVEGEKDVNRLRDLGFVSTTNPMGAGKWRDSYSEALHGADLVIIPDNDGPGHDHANKVAKSVCRIVSRLRILNLPGKCKDVSDWLDKGGDDKQLERLVANCRIYESDPDSILAEIVVSNRQLRDITADTLQALYRANKPERIFRRGGMPTRISLDEKQRPYIEPLNESSLRGFLARSSDFVKFTKNGDKVAVSPPLDVVRDCLSLGDWQFPPLEGVTEVPVIRPDGTIITKPGYDSVTGLFYHLAPNLSVPIIPENPNESELKTAIELTLEPLYDFPFDSEASRANAIAAMFTPVLRPIIDGPVPLVLCDKPQPGTGASYLARLVTMIATGRDAAMMPAPKSDEEWAKVITVTIIKGQTVMVIDNVEEKLQSSSLSTLLTSLTWRGRILGRSDDIVMPNHVTVIATGNNIRLGGDLPRRCIWIRMDAMMSRPWLRDIKSFKHPRLIEWVSGQRGALLAAILTVARAWVVAGMPEAPNRLMLGGYENYSRVIGDILAYIGVRGFLTNLNIMYDETDTETPQWAAFLETWYDTVGEISLTAADLVNHLNHNPELRASLPDVIADIEARNYSVRLGQQLGKRNGVRYPNGFVLVKAGEKRRAVTWKVMRFENATSHQISLIGEVGEVTTTPACKESDRDNNDSYEDRADKTSPNLTPTSESGEVVNDDIPEYPTHPCRNCGSSDYWLTEWKTWNCSICHPRPGGGED